MVVVSLSRPVRPPVGITREREIGGVRIATPCYGGVANVRFVDSLLRTQRLLDIEGIKNDWHCIDNESLIQRARNGMAAMFMTTGAEYLLFIDSDIQWRPESVLRLLAHDVDVICATYPKKCEKQVGNYSLAELQAHIDWLEWHKRALAWTAKRRRMLRWRRSGRLNGRCTRNSTRRAFLAITNLLEQ